MMCSEIDSNKLMSIWEGKRELRNVFSGLVATPEQTTDMLTFRDIAWTASIQTICKH